MIPPTPPPHSMAFCYIVGDNIDTGQIIPAESLTLVPSHPEEYRKLGSYALIGLPSSYALCFVEDNELKTKYSHHCWAQFRMWVIKGTPPSCLVDCCDIIWKL